jgi:hypothetical protein
MNFVIDQGEELGGGIWRVGVLDLAKRLAQRQEVISWNQGPPCVSVEYPFGVLRADLFGHAASLAATSDRCQSRVSLGYGARVSAP